MSAVVLIVGDGEMAEWVNERLVGEYEIVRQDDFSLGIRAAVDFALVLHDTWKPSVYQQAEKILRESGVPWLRGFLSFGEGVIGPLVRPNVQGCSYCADMRRLLAGRDRKEMLQLQQHLMKSNGEMKRDAWASRTGMLQISHLIVAEAKGFLQGNPIHSEGQVFLMNLKTLRGEWHSFLPSSLCPSCGRLPEDESATATISLQPSLKLAGSYRCRSLDELKNILERDYLDSRTGLLNGKIYDLVPPFADVTVNLPLLIGDEGVGGRTHSYEASEMAGILEGLERYCGLESRRKRTVIHDSFHHLQHQALDPNRVGLHETEQYEKPNFPFKAFHPNRPINWVWGYSFLQKRPILVPELLAYYSLGYGDGFVYETSNGCALGGSPEEAIFYGILEVVERDSFLMTWYARLSLPPLAIDSANDQELEQMIERIRAVAGYELYLFNATMENGIPSILAVAKNQKKQGLNLICAAGAHLDPIRAAKSAVHELAAMMLTLDEKFEANKGVYQQMLADSSLVQKMDDHGMLYGLPEAEERLEFLLADNRPLRTFAEEFKKEKWQEDLTDDLQEVLQRFRQLNLEVIVVDQTAPEISKNNLHCVKVLIPGMLPMTFGYQLTRLAGLERVLRIPKELGYTKQPLTMKQLNPFPHPFP